MDHPDFHDAMMREPGEDMLQDPLDAQKRPGNEGFSRRYAPLRRRVLRGWVSPATAKQVALRSRRL